MIKGTGRRWWVLGSMIALGLAAATVARADDIDNPQYASWSKYKVGSTATISADAKAGPNDVHIEITRTLKAVSPDSVEIETLTKVEAMGHSNNPMPVSHTVKAKLASEEAKETGTQDVQAMGKTYTCKVIELSGTSASDNGPPPRGSRPQTGITATVYVNPDVPGGMVKMEYRGSTGPAVNFILTAMDAK